MPVLSSRLCPLLSDEVLEKLKRRGIATVVDYVSADLQLLSQRTGLLHSLLEEVRAAVLLQCAPRPTTAADLWEELKTTLTVFSTGCSSVDRLLGGGVFTGELAEVCGCAGSGKTKICHSIASYVAMETSFSVAYIDTAGTFSSIQVQEMGKGRGKDEEEISEALSKVKVYQVFSLFDLLSLLSNLQECIAGHVDRYHSNLRVVIIDCVTPLISPLLGGRQQQGHALMCHLLSTLRSLAHSHSIAVVYTNNVVRGEGGEGVKPALGRTWSQAPSTRLSLILPPHPSHGVWSGGVEQRTASLLKSTRQCIGGTAAEFSIRSDGLHSTHTST